MFFVKLIIVLLSGILIGRERQKTHSIIGIRSISILMLGSFIFSYMSIQLGTDPSRIIAQVVSGVGFIGAGIVFKKDADKIANITTAILIWALAGLSCLIGAGFIWESIVITIIIYIILKYYKNFIKDGN